MKDYMMETAHKLGTYQAIADMMRRDIRNLDAAQAEGDEFMAEWHMRSLRSLADQMDEAEKKFKKEVDNVAI